MIDPKEIYIGAHYYNGGYVERVIGRVTAIYGSVCRPEEMTVGLIHDMPLDEDNDPYEHTAAINLEPIPLTPELLTEIGFELIKDHGGVLEYKHEAITIQFWGERIGLYILVGAETERSKRGMAVFSIRYLHELEAFVYLTTKTELIKSEL